MIIGIDASRGNRKHKSGTEWYSYHLIRALAAADADNSYILYSDSPLTGGLYDLTANEGRGEAIAPPDADGWQTLKSPHGNFRAKILGWPWRFFWSQGRLSLEMLLHRPDALFVPSHALPVIHPRRSIVTIHDIGFHRDRNLYERKRIGSASLSQRLIELAVRCLTLGRYGANSYDYLDWSTRYALKRSAAVIAVSDFTRRELVDAYGSKTAPLHVVLHSYDERLYRPLPDDAASRAVLARYGIVSPYIFYVGRLEKKKNTAALIEAFAMAKAEAGAAFRQRLYLIGDASYGYDEIKYTIHEFGVDNDVFTTGWIAEEDLPYIFARADAFVFPSNYEGFGIPLLQAMATGTPIASSDAASLPEVAGEAALLFDAKDIASMSRAIQQILTDQPLRQRLIAAGLERAKRFSWRTAAEQTRKIIEGA